MPSALEFDLESSRKLGRSISDNRANDNFNPNTRNFSFKEADPENSAHVIKAFKSEKYKMNGFPSMENAFNSFGKGIAMMRGAHPNAGEAKQIVD